MSCSVKTIAHIDGHIISILREEDGDSMGSLGSSWSLKSDLGVVPISSVVDLEEIFQKLSGMGATPTPEFLENLSSFRSEKERKEKRQGVQKQAKIRELKEKFPELSSFLDSLSGADREMLRNVPIQALPLIRS